MGRDDHVPRPEWMAFGQGLGIGHVETGGGDLFAVQGCDQGLGIDDPPRETLIRMTPGFIMPNPGRRSFSRGFPRQRHGAGHDIGPGQQGVKRGWVVQFLDEQRPLQDFGSVSKDPHAECRGSAGDLAADASQADDQDRLTHELVEDEPGPLRATLDWADFARSESDSG